MGNALGAAKPEDAAKGLKRGTVGLSDFFSKSFKLTQYGAPLLFLHFYSTLRYSIYLFVNYHFLPSYAILPLSTFSYSTVFLSPSLIIYPYLTVFPLLSSPLTYLHLVFHYKVVKDGIYVDFFYGLFAGMVLLFFLRPHWGSVFTTDTDVQALGKKGRGCVYWLTDRLIGRFEERGRRG